MNNFDEEKLIFLVSQPRSGSTMLQAVLSNNSYINTSSEFWLLLPFLYNQNSNNRIKEKYNEIIAYDALNDFLDKGNLQRYFTNELKEFLLKIYSSLKNNNEVRYVLDKTPRYYLILPDIIELFPNAKIILLKRNPIDVMNSVIRTWSIKKINTLLNSKKDFLEAPFLIHNFIEKNKNNPNLYSLKYEDYIKKPIETSKDIYQWLNLPFKEKFLEFNDNTKIYGKYGDPTGVKKHKKPTIIEQKEHLKPFFKKLIKGYEAYLGNEFLHNYGYEIKTGKRITAQFKYFFYLSKEPNFSFLNNFVKRTLYKYRFFQVEDWFLTEEKRNEIKKKLKKTFVGKVLNKFYYLYLLYFLKKDKEEIVSGKKSKDEQLL